MTPIPDIPPDLSALHLRNGLGSGKDGDRCAIQEVRAWLHLDASKDAVPPCVCPVIGAFVIGLNDADPRLRAALVFKLPSIIGSKRTPEVEHQRSLRVLDWYVREWLPTWLDLVPALAEHATALRAHPTVTDANAEDVGRIVRAASSAAASAAESAAWSAAWSAARSAAGSAAWSAAWSAAESAAESAARSAARSAAWSAAESAVWSAAWSAAESAAYSAAYSAATTLRPTVEALQDSALALLDELLAGAP